MSVGKRIKQLRELRNYTQSHMASKLNMTTAGYGKIERDQTDITYSKLLKISEILETEVSTILNFDSKHVFNLYNNKTATANGVVQNQQIIADTNIENFFKSLKDDIECLKNKIKDFEINSK